MKILLLVIAVVVLIGVFSDPQAAQAVYQVRDRVFAADGAQ